MTSIRRAGPRPSTAPATGTGDRADRRAPRRRGFTLLEVIIVFTLLGILVGMGIPQYSNAARRGREAVLKDDLYTLRKLLDQYKHDKGKFPASLQALVEEEYLRAVPVDPMTKSRETWVLMRETPPPDEYVTPGALGVTDVKSGSDAKALDGTLYNTW